MRIETSFGPLRITPTPFAEIDEQERFSQDSDAFVRDTDLGKAEFTLRFNMGEEGVESSVYVTVTSGTPGFTRDRRRLGYIAHVEVDPARGARRGDIAPRVSVQDLDNPRRILGDIVQNIKNPVIEEEVGKAVAKAVDAFLAENPGIAARFEAACLNSARQELDEEIKREWDVLSKLVSLRDRCRGRAAQSANDALGKERDELVEIKAVGESDRCAWLWAYEQNIPHDSEWDEVVATGVAMLNVNLTSPEGGYIDIDLVDGRTVSIALKGKDIRLEGKVIDHSEAIAQVERAGVVPEAKDLIVKGGDLR